MATAVGGAPDVVANGEAGYLVKPDDAEGMTEAIIELLRNPERAKAMGRAGRKAIYPKFAA